MTIEQDHTLGTAVESIRERFGRHIIIQPEPRTEKPSRADIPHIPTGFPLLDRALGIGGVPRGCLMQFSGIGTSGMTTLAFKIAANESESVIWFDPAHTFDGDYAVRCGVSLARLLLVQPERGGLDILYGLVSGGGARLIVCDLGKAWRRYQDQAALSQVSRAAASNGATVIFLTVSSAPSLTHLLAVRLCLQRERWLLRAGEIRGYRTCVTVEKNRYAPAGRRVRLTIGFSTTIQPDEPR